MKTMYKISYTYFARKIRYILLNMTNHKKKNYSEINEFKVLVIYSNVYDNIVQTFFSADVISLEMQEWLYLILNYFISNK